jgi:uncharacterized membrane protein YeaQ/YmgE (transglycosylase-associated protein family)
MGLCGWLGWLIFGFFAGLVARALMPGDQELGILKTSLLGIAGSFVGGLLGSLLLGRGPWGAQPSGFVGAVVGAVVLLALGRWFFHGPRRR